MGTAVVNNAISLVVLDLIASSLRLIGVLASGEPVPIEEANDALMVLDQMVDAWNADRLAIYATGSQDFPFVVGQQAYMMGPGGDFNTERPPRIDSISAMLLENPSNPIEVPMSMFTVDEWQKQMPVKVVNSSFPQVCYDDGGFPLRTLSFWPIPTYPNAARIYSWQDLTLPPTLQTVLSFPPGYAEAFRYNLAARLSAEFAAPLPALVGQIAIDSMARIRNMNLPELGLRSDLMVSEGGYNYKADLFGIPF